MLKGVEILGKIPGWFKKLWDLLRGVTSNQGLQLTVGMAIEQAKWLANKIFVWGIVTVVVPIMLYLTFSKLIFDLALKALAHAGSVSLTAWNINVTGIGGWLAIQVGLDNMISMLLAAVMLRFTLSFIKPA